MIIHNTIVPTIFALAAAADRFLVTLAWMLMEAIQ